MGNETTRKGVFQFLRLGKRTGTPAGTPQSGDLVGTTIGGSYDVLELLGRGGFGTVYKARHQLLDRLVAIKVIHPNLFEDNHSGVRERFENEARLTSKVTHPNAITVYDYGFHDKTPYLVMEYVAGMPLDDDDMVAPESLYPIARQIGSALTASHALGIVHLDLKPENVILTQDAENQEFVKVLDFGIAKLVGLDPQDLTEPDSRQAVGTPNYMAPEQIQGQSVDPRTDIYAFGVMLYRLICGCFPFPRAVGGMQLFVQKITEDAVPLNKANNEIRVSDELNRVIMTCLEREPDRRYDSVIALMTDLRRAILGGDPAGAEDVHDGPSMDEMLDGYDRAKREFDQGRYRIAFNRLNQLIVAGAADPQLIHLAVLSLARSGQTEQAQIYLSRHQDLMPATEDYLALNARLLKDRFLEDKSDVKAGELARDAYLALFRKTEGYYPAINAATLSLFINDPVQASRLADTCLRLCESENDNDYWRFATMAEASLLTGQLDAATACLKKSINCHPSESDRSITYSQLEEICRFADLDSSCLSPIFPARVLYSWSCWTPGVEHELSADQARTIAGQVKRLIIQREVGEVHMVLAGVTDVLIAEVAVELSTQLVITLPFAGDTLKQSVLPNEDWRSRWDAVLDQATVSICCEEPLELAAKVGLASKRHALGLACMEAARRQSSPILFLQEPKELADMERPLRARGFNMVACQSPPRRVVGSMPNEPDSDWSYQGVIAFEIQRQADPESQQKTRSQLGELVARYSSVQPHSEWNGRYLFTATDLEDSASLAADIRSVFKPDGDELAPPKTMVHAGFVHREAADSIRGEPIVLGPAVRFAAERLLEASLFEYEETEAFKAARVAQSILGDL